MRLDDNKRASDLGMSSYMAPILAIAAVVGLATWLAVEHQGRLRLAEERKALESQAEQMARLIAENEQLANQVARATAAPAPAGDQSRELLHLRGEVGVLREQTRDLEAVRAENRQARAALESSRAAKAAATADYWPREAWAFAGFTSPDGALQSSLWAANNGDLKTLAASATGEALKMMEADLAGKPETEASIRAIDEVIGLKSVRILNREVQADDAVVLTAEFETRTETHTGKLLLKKIGNGWKLAKMGNQLPQ
jgi:hypothetical protein